jgi:inhibitor of cysteine peptidase
MLQRGSRSWAFSGLSWDGTCLMFAILAAFSVAAIAQTPGTKSSPNPTVVVTDKDNEGQVSIAKGGTVVVRLPVTSGTGYSWALAQNGAPQLKPLGKSSMEKPKDLKPGATQIQVFHFTAATAGSTTLEFHYARPWEKNAAPAKTFQVRVTVQ